jgi:hypothetical protein
LTVVGRDEKALNETVKNCQNSQNVISVENEDQNIGIAKKSVFIFA